MTITVKYHLSAQHSKVKIPPKVIVLGDSIVYGYGDLTGGGWVERLKRQWMVDGPVLYNLGVRGDRTKDVFVRLEQEYSVRGELRNQYPDLIIFSIGVNDTARLGKPNGKTFTSQEDFQQHIEKLLELGSRLCQVVFVGMIPVDESRMPFLSSLYYSQAVQYRYKEITREACLARDIPYLDLFEAWQERGQDWMSLHLGEDGLHPNSIGYQKILEEVGNWEPIRQIASQSLRL